VHALAQLGKPQSPSEPSQLPVEAQKPPGQSASEAQVQVLPQQLRWQLPGAAV
jgi:hypothetical protein